MILDFLREHTGTSRQLCLLGRYIVLDTMLSIDLQSPLLVFAYPILLTVDIARNWRPRARLGAPIYPLGFSTVPLGCGSEEDIRNP